MTTKRISLSREASRLELSKAGEAWTFKGYASVFGSINCYGFAIAKGAYAGLISEGARPAMFFNHNSRAVPIGRWTKLQEDDYGLYVEGELSKGVRMAQDVHGALVDGLLDGLSVSIAWNEEDQQELSDGTTVLARISEMPEISLCTYPADGSARISEALSADELDDRISGVKTIRDFDGFLRDAAGLSRRQAKALVAAAKAAFAADALREAEDQEKAAALARIESAIAKLS